jgi:ABC-type transporter Mla subunit MlaD
MRRLLYLIMGSLQLAIAAVLIVLGACLPSTDDVGHSFTSADHVTSDARAQVRILRQQVEDLRRPEMRQVADNLRSQTKIVTSVLKEQHIDFDSVQAMRDALGDVATGLDGLATTLDPQAIGRLGDGLGETASFLEDKVVPSANQAADQLDHSADLLQADAKRLAELLRAAPLDLQAARDIHEGLGRFNDGLDTMSALLKGQRIDSMRRGFRGMEDALGSGADQVARLSDYTYPMVRINNLKPEVTQKPFWPEGRRIADGMRQAAEGATAAGKDLDDLATDLPKIRAAVDESRKAVARTRAALGTALEQQDKLGDVLRDGPAHAARLAEDLPKLGKDLSRSLRDTGNLRDVAKSLRQAREGIDTVVKRWPDLRVTLVRSATLLRTARQQLQGAIDHRQDYETAMRQSVALAESFSTMLPMMTDQLDSRLEEEQGALNDLDHSLQSVQEALPSYGQSASTVVALGRWLAWLGAAVVGLHGVHLLLSVRFGRSYAL